MQEPIAYAEDRRLGAGPPAPPAPGAQCEAAECGACSASGGLGGGGGGRVRPCSADGGQFIVRQAADWAAPAGGDGALSDERGQVPRPPAEARAPGAGGAGCGKCGFPRRRPQLQKKGGLCLPVCDDFMSIAALSPLPPGYGKGHICPTNAGCLFGVLLVA